MKIVITRSFSKKIQLKEYEPVESFCALTMELDLEALQLRKVAGISEELDTVCQAEVEKTLAAILRPPIKPIVGKSKLEVRDITKDEAEHDAGNLL